MPLDQIDNIDEYDESQTSGSDMSFFDHLDVLRWHIIRSVAVLFTLIIIVFLNKEFVFDVVLFGPRYASFPTFRLMCWMSDAMCIEPPKFELTTRELGETFFSHMTVSFWGGIILGFPYFIWEVWRFIKPGLYITEQKSMNLFVFVCTALFLFGVLFGYYIVAPLAVIFLAGYQIGDVVNSPTLSSYVSNMVMFTLPLGLVFELPVLAYVLGKMGVISSAFLGQYRRIAFVILLILAGFITPSPDIVSQMMVFAPLYSLYEVSIMVVKRIERKRLELEKSEAAAGIIRKTN